MKKIPKWTNHYIALVKSSSPDEIICCERDQSAAEVLPLLTARLNKFKDVYCELGCGSGEHLIGQAQRRPQALHIGFELRFKRTYRAFEKSKAAGMHNILFLQTDAMRIGEFFKAGSLQGVYVNFPDPWAKRRWRKHRMLSAEFIELVFQLLATNGFLAYKTDHVEYFQETLALLRAKEGVMLTKITDNLVLSEFNHDNISSEFESLFRNKGQPIYFLEAKKVGEVAPLRL